MKTLTVAMFDPKAEFRKLSLEDKINLIETKFKAAYALFKAENSHEKNATFLFVCPEYTFMNLASKTTHLSYSKEEMKLVKNRLTTLITEHPNAILVPGTAYEKKEFKENKDKYLPIIKKGFRDNNERVPAGMNLFEAWQKSDVSAVKNSAHVFGTISNGKKPSSHSYSKRAHAFENFINATLYPGKFGDAIFTVNGLRVGIEICADHQENMLSLYQSKNPEPLDIHLLVGNIVGLNPKNVANHGKNIIAINCAGNFSENSTAKNETGIWVGDENGKLNKLVASKSSTADIYFYPNIVIPNQKFTPSLKNSNY